MKSYRRLAAVGSILIHLMVLVGLSVLFWKPAPQQRDQAVVELQWNVSPPRISTRPDRPYRNQRQPRPENVQPPVAALSDQAIVPRDSLLGEAQKESKPDPDRQFFGDTLYGILQEYPELKPVVLQQMLVQNIQAYDSLATVEKQIAEALAPYLEMSDAERAARANMKRFGYARNPYQAPAIPGNIPISAIVMYLVQLLTQ
jgi:hypothetical protein